MTNTSRNIDENTKNTFEYIMSNESWKPFIFTAVFKAGGLTRQQDKFISYTKRNVIHKICRKLTSGKSNQEKIIPIDLIQYEFDINSKFKSFALSRYVHHTHGIIAIPTELVHKVWDEETNLPNAKLLRDWDTTQVLQSMNFQPYDKSKEYDYLNYILKGKAPGEFSWNN